MEKKVERIGLELMIYSAIILAMMLVIAVFKMNGFIFLILLALLIFIIGSRLAEKEEN